MGGQELVASFLGVDLGEVLVEIGSRLELVEYGTQKAEIAVAAMESMTFRKVSQITIRLDHACHPLLDREQFQPRVSPLTLVWPLQAPMIDEARFRLFKEVRIESGRPEGSREVKDLP